MILYILLQLLFFVVLSLAAVEQRRIFREMKKQIQDLSELKDSLTQRELQQLKSREQINEDQKLNDNIQEQLNTILQEEYKLYQKRGGTDDYQTFLQKSEMHELFP